MFAGWVSTVLSKWFFASVQRGPLQSLLTSDSDATNDSWMNKAYAFLLVGLGGAVGSMARYGVTMLLSRKEGYHFPYATFFVNVSGSFLIALAIMLLAQRVAPQNEAVRLLAVTGFLGGYTTFSTFVLETDSLASSGHWQTALVYGAGSVLAGLAAFRIAVASTRFF